MKIALYIEDGVEQIVLTPKTDNEKNILSKLANPKIVRICQGSFYRCQGGWIRQDDYQDDSTIIVIEDQEKEAQP